MRKHNQSVLKATPEKRTHRKVTQHQPPTKWQDSFINASLDEVEMDSQLTNNTNKQSSAQKATRSRQKSFGGLNNTQVIGNRGKQISNSSIFTSMVEPRSDSQDSKKQISAAQRRKVKRETLAHYMTAGERPTTSCKTPAPGGNSGRASATLMRKPEDGNKRQLHRESSNKSF